MVVAGIHIELRGQQRRHYQLVGISIATLVVADELEQSVSSFVGNRAADGHVLHDIVHEFVLCFVNVLLVGCITRETVSIASAVAVVASIISLRWWR